jgi:hypothetical protein
MHTAEHGCRAKWNDFINVSFLQLDFSGLFTGDTIISGSLPDYADHHFSLVEVRYHCTCWAPPKKAGMLDENGNMPNI